MRRERERQKSRFIVLAVQQSDAALLRSAGSHAAAPNPVRSLQSNGQTKKSEADEGRRTRAEPRCVVVLTTEGGREQNGLDCGWGIRHEKGCRKTDLWTPGHFPASVLLPKYKTKDNKAPFYLRAVLATTPPKMPSRMLDEPDHEKEIRTHSLSAIERHASTPTITYNYGGFRTSSSLEPRFYI